MWLLENLKLHAWFTFVVCILVLSEHWSRPSACFLLLLSYLQSMRHLVAVNQGVRYFWPCRSFEAGLQSVWGLVCLQLTFTPRVQSFGISTQRAGSLPGSLPLAGPGLQYVFALLSKGCISYQDRNVASRIKKLLMPLSYQYCCNLKAAKIRTVKLLRKSP